MYGLYESINDLKKLDHNLVLDIEVIVNPEIVEALPSGEKDAKYDDQTIEDWDNFTMNVEEIIETENSCEIIDVAHSSKGNKLSTYYNFFTPKDKEYECIINLRVSDHKSTTSVKLNRKDHVKDLINNYGIERYKLYGIVVNDKMYDSYDDALDAVRKIVKEIR